MIQDFTETCLTCGGVLENTSVCSYCGYEFSLDLSCPRLQGRLCIHTSKRCTERTPDFCDILRKND